LINPLRDRVLKGVGISNRSRKLFCLKGGFVGKKYHQLALIKAAPVVLGDFSP
jgi:hypothetical protein